MTAHNPFTMETSVRKLLLIWCLCSLCALAVPAPASKTNCNDGTWDLTKNNYIHFETDKNIQTWWAGGRNGDGPNYSPQPKGQSSQLTLSLASTFFPTGAENQFGCTLESGTCNTPVDCLNYDIHNETTGQVGPEIHWGWFATHAVTQVYSFAQAFHEALQDAGIQLSFDLYDLAGTFTKPSKDPSILTSDLIIGFSLLVTVAFSFVPVIGQIAAVGAATGAGLAGLAAFGGAAGGVLSTANGVYLNQIASGVSADVKASEFGKFMSTLWDSTTSSVDYLVSGMMSGQIMDGNHPLLLSVLDGGGWIDPKLVNKNLKMADLQALIYRDLLQRGINQIWLQSKIYVTFVNLHDGPNKAKCLADRSGWQASKTCADGGAYYLYRYDEDGFQDGHLDYPWGADKMSQAPYNLDPSWVTRSSAQAYRSQNHGVGGFAYDPKQIPNELPSLLQTFAKSGQLTDLGALPGVWNLSVCDMGGTTAWNGDFTSGTQKVLPCCCGTGCSQTQDWVLHAGMNNFDTLVTLCKDQMTTCSYWPAGTTQINYGDAGTIRRKDVGC